MAIQIRQCTSTYARSCGAIYLVNGKRKYSLVGLRGTWCKLLLYNSIINSLQNITNVHDTLVYIAWYTLPKVWNISGYQSENIFYRLKLMVMCDTYLKFSHLTFMHKPTFLRACEEYLSRGLDISNAAALLNYRGTTIKWVEVSL